VPSTVWILPLTLRVIGAGLPFFGSAFGVKPPFRVSFRFPAWTMVGFSAVAIPATATARAAASANVVIKRLRMCSISLLCGPAFSSLGHRKPWSNPSNPKLPVSQSR
jgi:hypothetical protein